MTSSVLLQQLLLSRDTLLRMQTQESSMVGRVGGGGILESQKLYFDCFVKPKRPTLTEGAADATVLVAWHSQQRIALCDAIASAQNILETTAEGPIVIYQGLGRFVAKMTAMARRPQAMINSSRGYGWDGDKVNVDSKDEHDKLMHTNGMNCVSGIIAGNKGRGYSRKEIVRNLPFWTHASCCSSKGCCC